MNDDRIEILANAVLTRARTRDLMIATAESCTGGLVASALTAFAGSSDVFERGFVTYSNAAKSEMLGVDPNIILQLGAVSPEVAHLMAEGALRQSKARLAVSITGIAGPGGGSAHKPVGLVYIATARLFDSDRVHPQPSHQLSFPQRRESMPNQLMERGTEMDPRLRGDDKTNPTSNQAAQDADTSKKPVQVSVREHRFPDTGRDGIRQASVIAALEQLLGAMAD